MTSVTTFLNFWCEALCSGFNWGRSYLHVRGIWGICQAGLDKYLKLISPGLNWKALESKADSARILLKIAAMLLGELLVSIQPMFTWEPAPGDKQRDTGNKTLYALIWVYLADVCLATLSLYWNFIPIKLCLAWIKNGRVESYNIWQQTLNSHTSFLPTVLPCRLKW